MWPEDLHDEWEPRNAAELGLLRFLHAPAVGATRVTTRPGPHHICPACGEISDPSILDAEAHTMSCTACGHAHRYEPLPPILFLTGPSGAGKSTVYRHLLGRTPEAMLIDQDLLWGMNPAFDDPATDYQAFRTLVLAMGMRMAANGRPVMIEGTSVPAQYERLPARPLVSSTAYLGLVCDDDVLERRLAARPAWRHFDDDRIAGMVAMNRALKADAATWDPPVELLDTTGRTVDETAAAVHEWIRRSTEHWWSRPNRDERRSG